MHKTLFGNPFFFFNLFLGCSKLFFVENFLMWYIFFDNVVIKCVFSNMYLIDIFVIEKYYFESKLLKSPIFEKKWLLKINLRIWLEIVLKLFFVFQNKENTFGSFSLFTFGLVGTK